jgi:hypothetical protein
VRYDSPEHHLGPGFPKNLPEEAAATHIGMFLAWVIVNELEGQDLKEYSSDLLEKVRRREITGRDFFLEVCDMRLWTSDLNEQANQFAEKYYVTGAYFVDYEKTLAKGLKSIYHVENNWKNFDLLAPILNDRFQRREEVPQKPWWKIW